MILILPLIIVLVVVDHYARKARTKRFALMKAGTPVCGACGHTAILDDTDRCPECGELYTHAGVYTQALQLRLGPPHWHTVITNIISALLLGGLTALIILLFTSISNTQGSSVFIAVAGGIVTAVVVLAWQRKKSRDRARILAHDNATAS